MGKQVKTATIEETMPESTLHVTSARPREPGEQGTEEERQDFVVAKFRLGWTKGAVKAALRKEFGPQPNILMERLLTDAKGILASDTETDTEMSAALDLFKLWTALHNIANAQIRTRERLHKSLGIPSPSEMLGLERDWGTTATAPREAVIQACVSLKGIMEAIGMK